MSKKNATRFAYFETPDYSVKFSQKQAGDPVFMRGLRDTHAQYELFLFGLQEAGILDEDGLTGLDGLLTFKQWKPGDAAIFGAASEVSEAWLDTRQRMDERWRKIFGSGMGTRSTRPYETTFRQGGQVPTFNLFSFNLIDGLVYNLPLVSMAKGSTVLTSAGNEWTFTNPAGVSTAFVPVRGVSVSLALALLEELFNNFGTRLTTVGITPSKKNMVKFLAVQAFINKDLSYLNRGFNVMNALTNPPKEDVAVVVADTIRQVIENDVQLGVILRGLDGVSDTGYTLGYAHTRGYARYSCLKIGSKMGMTAQEMIDLNGVPLSMLNAVIEEYSKE